MEQISRQTETSDSGSDGRIARRIVAVLFGIVEVVFAFRFLFKLFGADGSSGFVKGLYGITQPIVGIFEGIFPKPSLSGAVFEPATLIVLVLLALIGAGVLMIMGRGSRSVEKTKVE